MLVRGPGDNQVQKRNILEDWVEAHGDRLFRHALLRIGDRELAEDLVQETFLAALKGMEQYRGDASALTWLTGILRRKIADHFRRRESRRSESLDPNLTAGDSGSSSLAGAADAWSIDPGKIAEDREFWEVFGRCLRSLPPTLAEAYVLRDIEGESPKNVCEMLGITPTNLSMRVQRARLAMRDLLQRQWFSSDCQNS